MRDRTNKDRAKTGRALIHLYCKAVPGDDCEGDITTAATDAIADILHAVAAKTGNKPHNGSDETDVQQVARMAVGHAEAELAGID